MQEETAGQSLACQSGLPWWEPLGGLVGAFNAALDRAGQLVQSGGVTTFALESAAPRA